MTNLSLAQAQLTDGQHPAPTGPEGGGNAGDAGARRRLWIGDRPALEVQCSIEIERSGETMYAHVSLDGIDVDCGDEVLIHAAPTHIDFGDRIVTSSRATVVKAGPFQRWLTRMQSYLALTELYEVGFQPRHEIQFTPARPTSPAHPSSPAAGSDDSQSADVSSPAAPKAAAPTTSNEV